MAEWTPQSSFNQAGQPDTSIVGQDRMRVDPKIAYAGIPVQETGHPGIVESDGFNSVDTINQDIVAEPDAAAQAISNDIRSRQLRGAKYMQQTRQETYQINNPLQPPISYPPQNNHGPASRASGESFPQQSASGFSNRINIPSDGHLSELPPSIPFHQMTQEQTIPICVAPDHLPHSSSTHDSVMRELGQLLGTNQYAELYKECYSSHVFAGKKPDIARAYATHLLIDRNAVMCRLCFSGGQGFPHLIIHDPSCPLLHCFQRIDQTSPYQHLNHDVAIEETTHNGPRQVPIPRPEQEAFTSEFVEQSLLPTEFYTADSGQSGHARNTHILNSRRSSPHEVVPPKFKQYADVKARYRTFNNWPRTSKQKPKSLAQAGLFYMDNADHCKCFQCGGILRDWEDEDDPVVEHEKWFPDCPYIQYIIKVRPTEAAVHDTRVQQSRRQDVTEAFSSLAIDAQESLNLPDHINPDICAICRRREIAVTQMYCGHIVCRPCLPTPNAEGRYLCRLCGGEVVNTSAIDPFCRRSHSQRPM